MAYDEGVADRIRTVLEGHAGVSEMRSFGGLSFMLNGNMCCGVLKDELVVRVGPDAYEDSVTQQYARPMDFTGRPLKGWVYIAPEGFGEDEELDTWVERGIEFASSLPAK